MLRSLMNSSLFEVHKVSVVASHSKKVSDFEQWFKIKGLVIDSVNYFPLKTFMFSSRFSSSACNSIST